MLPAVGTSVWSLYRSAHWTVTVSINPFARGRGRGGGRSYPSPCVSSFLLLHCRYAMGGKSLCLSQNTCMGNLRFLCPAVFPPFIFLSVIVDVFFFLIFFTTLRLPPCGFSVLLIVSL